MPYQQRSPFSRGIAAVHSYTGGFIDLQRVSHALLFRNGRSWAHGRIGRCLTMYLPMLCFAPLPWLFTSHKCTKLVELLGCSSNHFLGLLVTTHPHINGISLAIVDSYPPIYQPVPIGSNHFCAIPPHLRVRRKRLPKVTDPGRSAARIQQEVSRTNQPRGLEPINLSRAGECLNYVELC